MTTRLPLATAAAAAATILMLNCARGASIFANGDFENGTWNPTTTAAGSPASTLGWAPSVVADEWMVGNLGNHPELWIGNPVMAKSGERFAWLRGGADPGAPMGSGALAVNLSFQSGVTGPGYVTDPMGPPNFEAGVTYRFSMWIADAGSLYNGLPVSLDISFWGGNIVLPSNLAWSDTATSVIPWQQVTGTFTPASSYSMGSPLLWAFPTGASGPDLPPNSRTSFVVDALELEIVPEPHSAGLLGIALLAVMRRGRRADP